MKLLGARVHAVASGTRTLKDAMNEALRDWVTNVGDTFYLIGSVAGPHPYPWMVRDLQSVIGREARVQIVAQAGPAARRAGRVCGRGLERGGPVRAVRRRCDDADVRRRGSGRGPRHGPPRRDARRRPRRRAPRQQELRAARRTTARSLDAHSISAGLDYPGVGPEHSYWKDTGRVAYLSRTDDEALVALERLARTEGILCALETAHAIAALDAVVRGRAAATCRRSSSSGCRAAATRTWSRSRRAGGR